MHVSKHSMRLFFCIYGVYGVGTKHGPNNASRHFSHMCMTAMHGIPPGIQQTWYSCYLRTSATLFRATQLARSNSPVTRGTCMPNFLYLLHACQRSPGYAAADVRTRARACRDLSAPPVRHHRDPVNATAICIATVVRRCQVRYSGGKTVAPVSFPSAGRRNNRVLPTGSRLNARDWPRLPVISYGRARPIPHKRTRTTQRKPCLLSVSCNAARTTRVACDVSCVDASRFGYG